MIRKLLILIPSYKRPQVIDLTLCSLWHHHDPTWEVTVAVGDNQISEETMLVFVRQRDAYTAKGIHLKLLPFKHNIGKAQALNELLRVFNGSFDVIVTMDNDMVVHKSWYWICREFMASPFDFVGVSSPSWWWHNPLDRNECPGDTCGSLTVYRPQGIAGGLLLFKPDFLRAHPWTNNGGVYGMDDGLMCKTTENRAVFYWSEDWITHDPLSAGENVPANLLAYRERKRALNESGVMIFPVGWDNGPNQS
jgi:glycosyltransferase involved in cell wall biosynthesis